MTVVNGSSRKRIFVLIPASILGLLANQFGASAEQQATTGDGRVVILSDNGTWRFQSSSGSSPDAARAALDIEAGLVFESGPRPVAREKFYLLDTSLNELVKRYKDATPTHKPLTI